jgi:hypothetical protein
VFARARAFLRVCESGYVRARAFVYICIHIMLLTILDHKTIYIAHFIVYNLIPFTSSMYLNSTQKLRTTAL